MVRLSIKMVPPCWQFPTVRTIERTRDARMMWCLMHWSIAKTHKLSAILPQVECNSAPYLVRVGYVRVRVAKSPEMNASGLHFVPLCQTNRIIRIGGRMVRIEWWVEVYAAQSIFVAGILTRRTKKKKILFVSATAMKMLSHETWLVLPELVGEWMVQYCNHHTNGILQTMHSDRWKPRPLHTFPIVSSSGYEKITSVNDKFSTTFEIDWQPNLSALPSPLPIMSQQSSSRCRRRCIVFLRGCRKITDTNEHTRKCSRRCRCQLIESVWVCVYVFRVSFLRRHISPRFTYIYKWCETKLPPLCGSKQTSLTQFGSPTTSTLASMTDKDEVDASSCDFFSQFLLRFAFEQNGRRLLGVGV